MRIKAIELEEVGTFRAPVAIGHIGPGLNVLAGANELGKSTILRGLTALFGEQHRAAKQSVRDLRPYAGGAPLIACTFDVGGYEWRLEKRYLAAQRALLKRLDGGETHQGADAENRLAELTGGEHGALRHLPLLWVAQGEGFEVPALGEGARQTFAELLAAQAQVTSGARRAQAVMAAVEAALGQLVTEKTGRPKKGGRYATLLTEHLEVSEALDAAREKAAAAERRVAQLSALQQETAALGDREPTQARAAEIAEQEKRLQGARDAGRQVLQLGQRVAFLESQKQQRGAMLAAFDEGIAEREALVRQMHAADSELGALAERTAAIGGALAAAAQAGDAALRRVAMLERRRDQLRRADAHEGLGVRLKELAARQQRLAEIAGEIDAIDTALKSFVWPETAIGEVRAARARIDQGEALIAAAAPRLRFSYAAGRHSGFRINGAAVGDGADVEARGPTTIEVEGVGRIDVIAAAGTEDAALGLELDDARRAFAEGLASVGAGSLAEAEARAEQRLELAHARRRLVAELDGLAPHGAALLDAEVQRLQTLGAGGALPSFDRGEGGAVLADGDPDGEGESEDWLPATIEGVEAALIAAKAEQRLLAGRTEELRADKVRADQRRAEIAAELRIRRTRGDELGAKYARVEGQADPRIELVESVRAAEAELNEAVRERIAVQEVALSAAALATLEEGLQRLRDEARGREVRLQTARQEMRHVEGMLVRDFEDGAAEQVLELESRRDQIAVRIGDCEEEIAALSLLGGELATEIAGQRDRIGLPLARRLTGMAAKVWPGAEIVVNTSLGIEGIVREGAREASDGQLSAGTREQIAVLARLAYAGMLAEGGVVVPVILDDPLAFSDDQRLDALFDAMAAAARVHQVIVLTCHERAFEPLITRHGATRLALVEGVVERAPA